MAHAFHAPDAIPNLVDGDGAEGEEMPEEVAMAMLTAHFHTAAAKH